MILAPAIMTAEADPKVAASKCLEAVGLDPDSYRCGHTKACSKISVPLPDFDLYLYSSLDLTRNSPSFV